MKGNGTASLRVWPVDVELSGAVYRIAPHPAIRWIIPIVDQDWFGIVPGLIDDERLDDAIFSGKIHYDDCVRAAQDAVSTASGMPWWSCQRLIISAAQLLDLSGALVIARVDPATISLGAYAQAVYHLLVRDADQKQRDRVDREIETRPPGVSVTQRYDADAARSGFEEMLQARGGW